MQIRSPVASEVQDVAELWCDAFPGDRTVADRSRMLESGGRYGGLETVLVAEDPEGGIAAACKIYRLTEHLTGVAMPMMGLAAVAVRPSRRRHGVGGRLCSAALRAALDRGDVVSVLYPFRPAYYRRLGWELVGELHEHRVHTATLPAYPEASAVREARGPADAEAIAGSYARAAARSHGPLERDRRIWAYRFAGQDLGVKPLDVDAAWDVGVHPLRRAIVYDDGGVTGYAMLRYAPASSPEEHTLQVRELVAEDEIAYRGLIGHLAAQADQWPRTRHFARPAERFGERLGDPRPPGFRPARNLYFPTARIVRGPMLRVLNVPEAARLRRWFDGGGPAPEATLRVEVDDPDLPENRGPWRIRIEDGTALVERDDTTSGEVDATMEVGAAAFARIFAGQLPPSAGHRIGIARVEGRADLLDRAFAVREPFWLLDEF